MYILKPANNVEQEIKEFPMDNTGNFEQEN